MLTITTSPKRPYPSTAIYIDGTQYRTIDGMLYQVVSSAYDYDKRQWVLGLELAKMHNQVQYTMQARYEMIYAASLEFISKPINVLIITAIAFIAGAIIL